MIGAEAFVAVLCDIFTSPFYIQYIYNTQRSLLIFIALSLLQQKLSETLIEKF